MTEAERRYRAFLDNTLDGVVYAGPDGTIVEMNRAMLDMLGYHAEDVAAGRLTRSDLVDPHDPRLARLVDERERSGRVRGELDFRRKDGSTFPVELTSASYLDADGGPHTIVVVRDMTDRVRAERALRESEERFATAFRASPAPIALIRLADGRLIDVNPAFTATFGYARDEAVGSTVGALGLAPDREMARRVLHALQEHGTSSETEVSYHTKDGRVGFGVLRYEPVELRGEPCVVLLMHDVTSRRRAEEALRVARERLARAEASALVMTVLVGLDGRMLKVPPRLGELLGYGAEELQDGRFHDFTHPDDRASEREQLRRLLAGEAATVEFEKRHLRRDGSDLWVSLNVSLVRGEREEPLYFLTYVRDISDDRRLREELRTRARQQEAVARLAERMPVERDLPALLDQAARTVAEALGAPFVKILELSPSGTELYLRSGVGWRTAEAGSAVFRTDEPSVAVIALRSEAPVVFSDLTRDGRFESIPLLREHGVHSGVSVVMRDADGPFGVIEAFSQERGAFGEQEANVVQSVAGLVVGAVRQRRLLDTLAHRALHDELTGLPNRAAFEERLQAESRRAQRSGVGGAVMFLDLDRFKEVNDTLGHHAGDELLRRIPVRIGSALRGGDVLARLAGDEFVLMLPDVRGERDLSEVAERILRSLDDPFVLSGREVSVAATLGICRYPDDGLDAAELLRHADTAMYQGKISGRNTFTFYVPAMDSAASRRLELEGELRRALQRREFDLVYQPQVDLATGRTRAVEALLRWRHPVRGTLLPDAFLPLAEDSGWIVPIGAWVLEEALGRFAGWKRAGVPLARLAVNVAAAQFDQSTFPATLARMMEAAGVAAGEVDLEIAEAVVSNEPERVATALAALGRLGVGLALDDFGTGYASLAHLRRLGIDRIKIDGAFTRRLDDAADSEGRAMVEAMIGLARSLGIDVVAEGIETEGQRRVLLELGCSGGQGSLFGDPVTAGRLARLLPPGPERESA